MEAFDLELAARRNDSSRNTSSPVLGIECTRAGRALGIRVLIRSDQQVVECIAEIEIGLCIYGYSLPYVIARKTREPLAHSCQSFNAEGCNSCQAAHVFAGRPRP